MSNGECPVGSSNKAKIISVESRQDRMEKKLDSLMSLAFVTLGGIMIQLVILLISKLNGG